MKILISILMVSVLVAMNPGNIFAGFSLDDAKDKLNKSGDCKEGDKGCEKKKKLKKAGTDLAVSAAVTLIADMAIEFKTMEVSGEAKAIKEYKKKHKNLPNEPVASVYLADAIPGNVIEPGKKVAIRSNIVVVPGSKVKTAFIEEKLSIFDNDDHAKELKSLTKPVNAKTKRGGNYNNEFSFKLPVGLPQGIYPVNTSLLLNGTKVSEKKNDLQLVLHIDDQGRIEILAQTNPLP